MFTRIKLPYDYADLEPCIDRETVETHYEKHHKTYTEKFNKLVDGVKEAEGKSALEILSNLDALPQAKRNGIRNNGGGFYNHNLYFESLSPEGKKPSSAFGKEIDKAFGSMEEMLDKLHSAATADLFGSGWAWLVADKGKLSIVLSPNQDLPRQDNPPALLLPVDMWEHAYYLKYKNDKKEYVKNLYRIIDWGKVEERFESAGK